MSLAFLLLCIPTRVVTSKAPSFLHTTSYYLKGNSRCEQFNGTLHNLLQTLPVSRKRNWHACLPYLLYCYNTTSHQSMGEPPFPLMFGQDSRLITDFLLGQGESPVGGFVNKLVGEH